MESNDNIGKNNRESRWIMVIHICFLLCAIVVLCRIVHIQCCFKDSDPYLARYFKPPVRKVEIEPVRGNILSHDGRLLAVTVPMYQVYMDCSVRKKEFHDKQVNDDPYKETVWIDGVRKQVRKTGAEMEADWRSQAGELAKGLSNIYGNTADYWRKLILSGRDKGSRHVRIGGLVDHETLVKIKKLPLFEKGPNKGGIIVEKVETRQYPYGSLARRTIGYVKDNSKSNGNNAIGLEGSFNYALHGTTGYKWLKTADKRSRIASKDSSYVAPENGKDIRTTLDIDIQDIADKALRTQMSTDDAKDVEGGCVIVMDVRTGAVRAMVNLLRDSTSGRLSEAYNYAIGQAGEPGSVFKTATLMSVLDDGKARLSDEMPTNHGRIRYFNADTHILDYERENHTDRITIKHGYEISSNYVFRKLAIDNYGDDPQKFLDNLYQYKFGEAFDFDLKGLMPPTLPSPKDPGWSGTSLGSVAIGYSVSVTPLQILTFYNAIANKGRMMKPYLVEDIEVNGDAVEKRGQSVLNASICSKSTADTLTAGLMSITQEGTATKLKNAKLPVAGKTGTARMILDPKIAKKGAPYEDKYGRKRHQATFVGFFPAENPKYSAIVVMYSKLGEKTTFGGTFPALTMKDIVDNIYCLESDNGVMIKGGGKMPEMAAGELDTAKDGKVPNLTGLGLMDAIYAIENDGYKCSYTGMGHVVSQSPAAGAKLAEGGTVSIKLK